MTPMTYKEIGRYFNITPSAVEQIERRAMVKLEMECIRRGITLEDVLLGSLVRETRFQGEYE